MTIVSGIGTVLHTIISAIVSVCATIVRFFTCGYCGGGGRRARGGGMRGGGMRRSRRVV